MTAATREKIVETAARLFHEQGFASTGVATILREANVNSGSLYHFFSSKDELLKGVLEWYLKNLEPIVTAPVAGQEPDPILRVFRLLDWYRQYMLDNECRMGCPVGNLALEVSDTHPEIRHLVNANFDNWAGILQSWLEEGSEQLPADTDCVALARFVLTVMEGGILQARAAGSVQPYDQSVAHLRKYIESLQAVRVTHSCPIEETL
jgi:TetR/AcrR family transcriptional repressor of nem operon